MGPFPPGDAAEPSLPLLFSVFVRSRCIWICSPILLHHVLLRNGLDALADRVVNGFDDLILLSGTLSAARRLDHISAVTLHPVRRSILAYPLAYTAGDLSAERIAERSIGSTIHDELG